ncbi:Vanillate O-demethylase oxidoreductase [Stutzerimonas stutzeri]|uniref:Vanillate O-demethylase oxidoreductase n=1 Tax=Stutzerimonas stutzeri TaxID=316 RepID=W8R7P0_STUST|nr:PDR/VanB family oxidoreductase [Stutzerimonas stutzeri]AHL74357.1 Vanillate O-demethylase oxidoreductase [Stutzerimonas stutzeri]MCQ4330847.1 PDR/VanB family oxidoreductase [Stutzerimonas stutzeri]
MIEVIVSKKCSVAEGICSFELIGVEGPLPAFEPGAHIDVHVAPGVIRQYSLCNDPAESHRYVIGVLNEPASRGGSRGLHEGIKVGDRLHIGEPRNLFALDPTATRHLLFAGGIGVTPILSMAWRLHAMGAEFEMHYCSRSKTHAAFVDAIEAAPFADRVQFHFDNEPAQQKLDAKAVLSEAAAGTHVYVCGPSGFMDHVLDTARQQGWADGVLHREYFVAPTATDTGTDKPFELELKRSGLVVQVPAELTALQVLEAAGVAVESSCEQGICGACLTPVLEGEPEHRDQFLTDAERARNDQFTPCCSRAQSARLVLDL